MTEQSVQQRLESILDEVREASEFTERALREMEQAHPELYETLMWNSCRDLIEQDYGDLQTEEREPLDRALDERFPRADHDPDIMMVRARAREGFIDWY